MTGEPLLVNTPDGRRLEAMVAGPPGGRVLVFHTGTPSGPAPRGPMVEAAAARGLRVVICVRPGYSRSDPRPGRTIADVAGDTAAVLSALGAEEFVTAGWSGGGPHALACAALLPGRCRAAASMAGVAPYRADGLDWLAGMGPENVEEFGAAALGEEALGVFLGRAAQELGQVDGRQIAQGLGELISAADAAVLTGEFADYLAASMRAAVSHGTAGWRDDDLAFVNGWGFAPADAGAASPVAIWQGDQDRMVPWSHGEWLAANIPGARSHMLRGPILDELLHLAGWAA